LNRPGGSTTLRASREADAALASLAEIPESTYTQALAALARLAVERTH
jgi:geranylgeranyl pyrophosphate synthase